MAKRPISVVASLAVALAVQADNLALEPVLRHGIGLRKPIPLPAEPGKSKSAEWNRGAYLLNGPGNCGEHLPAAGMSDIQTKLSHLPEDGVKATAAYLSSLRQAT